MQATVDYTHPYLTTKGSCTLNPTPVVDLSAVVGYSGFLIGGNAVLNVTQSKLTKWTAAASYNTDEMVATAHVADALDSLKLTYWQKIDAASTIGAEVVHTRATSAVAIALGYAHVNPSGTPPVCATPCIPAPAACTCCLLSGSYCACCLLSSSFYACCLLSGSVCACCLLSGSVCCLLVGAPAGAFPQSMLPHGAFRELA